MTNSFYITTPIYYANSLPHLGHLYTTIVADAVNRYKKQRGLDTYFLTGTDEHGINIQRAADKAGRSPQGQVDFVSGELKRMFHDFGLDSENGGYDVFMRTTEPFHYEGVQHLWREIAKNKTPKGKDTIYKGFYEGWFCAPCAEFKSESEYILKKSGDLAGTTNLLVEIVRFAYQQGVISLATKDSLADRLSRIARDGIEFNLGVEELHAWLENRVLTEEDQQKLEKQYRERLHVPSLELFDSFFSTLPDTESSEGKELFKNLKLVVEDKDLLIPRCLIHGTKLELTGEESYFFRLSDYEDFLLKLIEANVQLVQPDSRRNEVISFIKGGLQDLSISREKKSVSWGIPVPDDENHVMYVWLDALSNYITAIGYGNAEKASVGFDKYWRNATHLVGKDILRFHTVYWFSFLAAAGLDLPKTVYAHGMWLDADGRKMGKTLGNVIDVDVLHEHFQIDVIRYFLLRDMVFGQDGKFGYENLIDRANADLASGLGNLGSRTFSMITKYREGLIPNGKIAEENYINAKRAGINPDEQELVSVLEHARDEFLRRFENFEFSLALELLWTVIARIDKMISDSKPWELIKDEKQAETLNAVLYRSTETLRWLCVLLYPVMPEATRKIYLQIGSSGDIAAIDPSGLTWGELQAQTKIGETEGVFPRIDKIKVMNEIKEQSADSGQQSEEPQENLQEKPAAAESLPPASAQPSDNTGDQFINIEDFLKVELRVGQIMVAERIPKADKLLRFEIDLGEEKPRQILAGLAEYYEPEKLIGRKVVVVANLKPRKMRGLESQGMICAASLLEEDTPAIATFLEDVKVGARLK
ncbi:MAG: methionine--tRNA ligase subunit beta [Pyrinomonadaceae bacterium]